MEKQAKPKSKILKFLPKALSFQNPPYSPGPSRDKTRSEANAARRGFSAPMVSIVPREARRRSKSETPQEPTSPKVSCMGQIKNRHMRNKKKMTKKVTTSQEDGEKRRHLSLKNKMAPADNEAKKEEPTRTSVSREESKEAGAPALGQMRRLASGRSSLSNFDWKAQVAPAAAESDLRNCYSDEERDEGEEEEEEGDVVIPFSAPIVVGGDIRIQPKKEINLWKRRTMARPRPLQLFASS